MKIYWLDKTQTLLVRSNTNDSFMYYKNKINLKFSPLNLAKKLY